MSKSPNQKQKLIRLMQLLYERTDEEHPASAETLIGWLAEYNVPAERKSIYSDLETLAACGCDIARRGGGAGGYFIAGRDFELAELKLLVDAVQSSRFITLRKSNELIRKIERLASAHQARGLQRQVYVAGRIKTMNESIYYNVDRIHAAISAGNAVRFRYFRWGVGRGLCIEKRYGRAGGWYEVSPWALTWDEENYYLVAYDAASGSIRHYRVDKMEGIESTERPREGAEAFQKTNPDAYARRVFGMFRGEEQAVTLRFSSHMVGVMRDRFGADLPLRPDEEEGWVRLTVTVDVSPQFYGWLCGLGDEVAPVAPDSVAEGYRAHLREILARME